MTKEDSDDVSDRRMAALGRRAPARGEDPDVEERARRLVAQAEEYLAEQRQRLRAHLAQLMPEWHHAELDRLLDAFAHERLPSQPPKRRPDGD
jgi:hypothetical protein